MNEYGHNSFPLTVAQRGLWMTQKITPGAILNIAEAVEICGPINPEVFRRALHQVVAEAEQLRVCVVEDNGKPRQVLRPVYAGDFPYVDMSREADPRAAIQTWMMHEVTRPVDLRKDPLWVSALLKASDDCYFWYQRAHHIVYDGYGGGLVARRLAELYTAYTRGEAPEPRCFCTVEAMVEAEGTYRNSDRFHRDREYWQQQLAQLPEAVTLSHSPRRHGLSSELRRSVGYLSAEIARQLAEFGKSAGASLPQVLISLIAAYYQRVAGVRDLVFGMPVSGRINGALRNSVSVSANVVPIRISFTAEMTAADLFAHVSRTVRQALRHQQYRYEDMRRDLGLVGQGQNVAWLGVNIEPFDYRLSFDGAATLSHNVSNSSAEDLMVFVYDRGTDADLRFDLDANPALYEMAELDEHRRRLLRLIEQVLAHPSTPLREIDILGDKERQRLLCEWNNTATSVPDISVPKLVEQWASATPEAPAVVFEDTTVSYRELHERSLRQARWLLANGVQPGDIVAVALPRSEQLLVVLLAIMRTGAAYLPIELDSPNDRIALVLDDASPTVLIAEPQMHAWFKGNFTLLQPECGDALLDEELLEPDLSTPEGIAYVLYTSGSTGRPKGVEITHRNLGNFLHGMQQQLRPTARDRFLAVTTITFDIAGLELYLPLMAGARVVMASSEALHNPQMLARLIQHSGATHVQATPSLWRVLLSSSETTLDDVHVLVGGEALSADLAARLKSMAARVTQFYGPTETTVWSTAFELEEIATVAPAIGRPILNTQIYVLDEDREPVVTGAVGELYIGGAGVAKGYLKRPELTAERFVADPFAGDGNRMYRTGDLVRWSNAGLLEFIGRADDQVKINGHRIELGEIESLLLQHPAVAEAAVAAHRKTDSITSLAAYLVTENGHRIEVDTLRGFLAGRVPAYMMPSSFVVLDAMPLTPNGKLDRKSLAIPERADRMAAYAEPVTPVEKKLAALWQEVLNVERVGLHDNFFDLGGDSLSAAVMAALFPEHLQVEIPLGSVFEAPTIADFAVLVEQLSSETLDPIGVMLALRTVSKNAYRPLFCIHPMAGISLGFSSLLRHLDPSMPVYGLQSRGLRMAEQLPASIEQIAVDYLAEIRRVQPEGPYRLVGRSLGGLIGHSIVERMQAQGLEVEMLAMIDSYVFAGGDLAGPRSEAEEVRAVMGFLDTHLLDENTPQTLKELAAVLVQTYDPHSIPLFQEIIRSNPQFIHNLCAVMINHLALARQYMPGKIDVDLLYFQAMENKGDLEGILDRSPSAWRRFIGGRIEVHELACHHEGVLDSVPAAQIGNTLRQWFSMPRLRRAPMASPSMRSATGEMSIA